MDIDIDNNQINIGSNINNNSFVQKYKKFNKIHVHNNSSIRNKQIYRPIIDENLSLAKINTEESKEPN